MNKSISTKRLWEILIHDVFDTYIFRENKWKAGKYNNDMIVGPTYFHDRKECKCPFNAESVNRFQIFYQAVLDDQMKKDAQTITDRMCQVLKREFNVTLDFLIFFKDDTPKLREAKKDAWIMLITNLAQSAVDVDSVPMNTIMYELTRRNVKWIAWIAALSMGTYTGIVLQNMPRRKDEEYEDEDRYEDEVESKVESEKVILQSMGIPIFLFDYSGTMSKYYIQWLKGKSKYEIECLRTITDRIYQSGRNIYVPEEYIDIFVSKAEFDKMYQQGDLFCIRDYSYRDIPYHTAFSKRLLHDMLQKGKCVCVSGDLDAYMELKKIYPQTMPLLLLSDNQDYVIKDIMEGVSLPGSAVRHIDYLCQYIERIKDEVPDAKVIIQSAENYDEIVKQIDACMETVLFRADYNAKYLHEYVKELQKRAAKIKKLDL